MTETLYTATSEYVEEIKALPVKRRFCQRNTEKIGRFTFGLSCMEKTGSFGHVCSSYRFKRKNPKDL